ncbi:MAG: hypothetical protein K2X66_00920 [Cyanobacteria bacterium]|nr:hypothetical protein [Cyanobacteriota bacterium]
MIQACLSNRTSPQQKIQAFREHSSTGLKGMRANSNPIIRFGVGPALTEDTFTSSTPPTTRSCSISEKMKTKWSTFFETDCLFDNAPIEGLTLGDFPLDFGNQTQAVKLFNAFANLMGQKPELKNRFLGDLSPIHSSANPTVAMLEVALKQAFGDNIPGELKNLKYLGKINTTGTNEIHRFDLGGKSYALKVYTGIASPALEFRGWKYFEGQGAYNTQRVYVGNVGTELYYSSSTPGPNRPWILSELITPETLKQPGRGPFKITEIAERDGINLGSPRDNNPQVVDAVYGVAVDGGNFKDPKDTNAIEISENLLAWKREGF